MIHNPAHTCALHLAWMYLLARLGGVRTTWRCVLTRERGEVRAKSNDFKVALPPPDHRSQHSDLSSSHQVGGGVAWAQRASVAWRQFR
jgi:hypothetical protein